MQSTRDKVWYLLILLLTVDLLFIILHILAVNHLVSGRFSIERDGGIPEFFQYSKEAWLALVLASVAMLKQQRVYWAWSGFFAFLLLDDSLRLHETGGQVLQHALHFNAMFNLRAQDFGELAVYGVTGLLFSIWIVIAHFNSDSSARTNSVRVGLLVVALFFCGVIVDMLHSMAVVAGISWSRAFALLEDGGEMIIASVICMVVFRFALASGLKGALALDWLLQPLLRRTTRPLAEPEEGTQPAG